MKKILVALAVMACATVSYAYDKGEQYIAPVLGYHFFDDAQHLDDNIEGGLRYGKFLSDKYSLEAEAGYTNTDKDHGGNQDAVSLGLNLVRHFDYSSAVKPYAFLGLGAELYDETHKGAVAGLGAALPVSENLAVDLRVKDMYMTDNRNDVVPSVALNYYFGKAKPVVAAAPAPAPEPVVAKTEPAPAPAAVAVAPAAAVVKAAPLDTDGDGVIDDNDKCPATPKGVSVDSQGCPLDSDGDGVFDYLDKCPNTPKGYKVNADGCFVAVDLNVNFKTSSNKIIGQYNSDMKKFADFMNANPNLTAEIQGYTDSRGSAVANKKLSQRRADAVMKDLVKTYGVSASRLTAVGYGEESPLVPNTSAANMAKNRRVVAVIK